MIRSFLRLVWYSLLSIVAGIVLCMVGFTIILFFPPGFVIYLLAVIVGGYFIFKET